MKHSLWRLISSFYILLISGLMVIISAYAWMVISKAPGVNGSSVNVTLPKVLYDTVTRSDLTSDGHQSVSHITAEDGSVEYWINSAEDFITVMRAIDEGKIGGNVSLRLRAHISLKDTSVWNAADWNAVSLPSSLTKLTIYADTAALKTSDVYLLGLTDSLFSGAELAGNTSIELRNITLLEAEIENEESAGAFIANANMNSVSVLNCSLIDSAISGDRVGGIAGSVTAGQIQIKNCTVSGSKLEGVAAVGGMIGTMDGGAAAIADPIFEKNELFRSDNKISEKIFYDKDSFNDSLSVLNLVNTELSTVEAYGGFLQAAADCFDEDTLWQTWSVYGTLRLENEIRFRGNHVDIVGKENAVIELSGNSVASQMGRSDSPAGFNFGQLGVNTESFQKNSSVKFADITFKNTKETNENTNDIAYYMYANARNVSYSNCNFDRGILVFGSAHFSNCKITDDSRYCVKFGSSADSIGSIMNSELMATETAEGCVLAEGTKQLLAIYNSNFDNDAELPAVYVTGSMPILTDGRNYFDSPYGGILAETKDTCSFNGTDFYCPTEEDYLNADILTKSQMNRTEHGNNAATNTPDADIPYDSVEPDQIPLEILPDSIDAETDTKTYIIDSTEKFIAVMRMLNEKDENGVSVLSGHYRIVLKTHVDLTSYFTSENVWESVDLNDANKTLKTITIEADTETLGTPTAFIKGLNAPWFGTLTSKSKEPKLIFEDITAIYSVMNLNASVYSNAGVYIATAKISATLSNCHLLNSEIFSMPNEKGEYSRLGGLIGYTNAPEVMIRDCSVQGCSLRGASVGGIVGHASASQSNETYIVDCFVESTVMACLEANASWRVGEIVGTANQGGVTIVNPLVSGNTLMQESASDIQKNEETQGNDPNYFLYGRFVPSGAGKLIFVDNQSEVNTALVYGGMNVNSTQFLTSNEQIWLIYDTARVKNEIKFTGNDITLKPYGESATLLLNSAVATNGYGMGRINSPSGFNFGAYKKDDSFKPGSKILFENLNIQNQKTCTTILSNDRLYTYAFAEDAIYKNCTFEDGVVVYGNAVFDSCTFKTVRANDLCLVLDNDGYDCEIKNCTFEAKDDAKSCVVSHGTGTLIVQNSEFTNQTASPAVILNGQTTVITDQANIFYSQKGGILASDTGATFNGNACVTITEYENADQLTKANYDRTEHGNNGGLRIEYLKPTAVIPDVSVIEKNADGAYLIKTADEFIAVMQMLNAKTDGVTNISEDITILLQGHFDFSDYDWESVSFSDTNKTLKTITIKADTEMLGTPTSFIKGLQAPLFAAVSSEATSAKLVLENLTITDSQMNLKTEDYSNSGAFVSNAGFKYGSVSVINCHLQNTKIITESNTTGEYSRVGGIVGYSISSNLLIQDCSVRGCEIVGASVGGIIGHASASQSNETYIVDCFVENTKLSCKEANASWRVGEIVGTANQGGVTVVNPMVSGNTLVQEGAEDPHESDDPNKKLYGRFVPSGRGKLIFVDNKAEINQALVYGGMNPNAAQFLTSEKQEWLIYGSVSVQAEMRFMGNDITLKPYGESAELILNSVSKSTYWKGGLPGPSGFNFGKSGEYKSSFKQGTTIRFENLTIKNQKTYYNSNIPRYDERSYTYAYAENVFFTDCTFEGGVVVYANATFDSCSFGPTGVCLVLSDENSQANSHSCILINCKFPTEVPAASIEENSRFYEVRQKTTD